LILCWLQHHFQIISLDSASYSMSSVPIDLNPWIFIAVSLGTLAVCVAAMLIPAAYISHVQPAKSIKMS
jgi:lipoprotein-releasing system permease protein